jgi:hypothetical protein
MRLVHDQPRALIELKCTGEAGPGWKELMTAQQKNPAEIRWGGYWIEAVLREYHGWVRPAIVLNRDLGAGTTATVTSLSLLEGEAGGTPPTLSLGEGVQTFDEKLYQKLKAASKEPERFLPMRVGCGVFGCWYGYSGGGVDVDQFWVDKATGRILREEGFRQGEPQFVVAYGDFEKTSDNGQVPRRIVVRLLSNPSDDTYPWVFQMDFQLLDGKAWLLKELKESQGQQQNVAIAAVTGARLGAADARRTRNQPSGTTNREAALAKPADHPLPAATKGTGPGAAAPR